MLKIPAWERQNPAFAILRSWGLFLWFRNFLGFCDWLFHEVRPLLVDVRSNAQEPLMPKPYPFEKLPVNIQLVVRVIAGVFRRLKDKCLLASRKNSE